MSRPKRVRVRARIVECECGRLKTRSAYACDRCKFLDGGRIPEVVFALRQLGGSGTYEQLQEILGRDKISVVHSITSLVQSGRVVRRHVEIASGWGGQNVETVAVLVDRKEAA